MFHSLDFGMIICEYIHAQTKQFQETNVLKFKENPTIRNQVYFNIYIYK